MKITKNMVIRPSGEARELALFAENDSQIYRQSIKPTIDNLRRKVARGTYDAQKAIIAFYYVADAASRKYNKDFGYSFTVTERCTAAADLLDFFEDEIFA